MQNQKKTKSKKIGHSLYSQYGLDCRNKINIVLLFKIIIIIITKTI